MKPEAQRLALAKLDGWTALPCTSCGEPSFVAKTPDGETLWRDFTSRTEGGAILRNCPDYLGDLNALHALEKKLSRREYWEYADVRLKEVVWKNGPPDRAYQCATAAERGEAILRATNLWTDDER